MAATFRPGLHRLFPLAQSLTLTSDTLQLRQKVRPATAIVSLSSNFTQPFFARPRPPRLLRIHAVPIDLDSPDWDPSPSALEDLQSDPYTLPTVKFEQPDLPEVKSEVKSESVTDSDEPNEPTHHSSGVQPATATSTQASPPPPKTPPVPAPYPPKHSTTHRARTASSATGATPKPPPPSPTTSSEDPVLLMTNVPILKKARPGQPPLRLFTHQDPPSTTTVPPPALAPSLLRPQPDTIHPPPLPTHRQTQVRIPRPHHNGHIMPFHFSDNILRYLNSNMDRSSSTLAAPPCPAPPPAFPTHGIPPPPQPAPPALFPPLPPLPELPLTDQQANQLTTAILRIARRAAAAAATNMLADNEP